MQKYEISAERCAGGAKIGRAPSRIGVLLDQLGLLPAERRRLFLLGLLQDAVSSSGPPFGEPVVSP
ncbi:hypothetical protein E1267_27120 [Nonomuraea longispora]|uniref:Uncharacterized protein n=1 Tax=Nonomuraea longispora TaxID=1848320 RepID=A0A4R4N3G3_9ACTN|nr:hypothetical protein [Nonomuraea longispora]TDC03185.1 hypothetical protein E1267_27120 [Nonomuraea longispora]